MGNRGNIVIVEQGVPPLFLYTHNGGDDLADYVQAALTRVPSRWSDGSYLARNIFGGMIAGDPIGEYGFGIATYPPDNEHAYLVVDVDARTVAWRAPVDGPDPVGAVLAEWPMRDFVQLDLDRGEGAEPEGDGA